MNFGERLKNIRRSKRVSQKELGQRLGVSQQTIAQYEKAESTPKASTVNKIANALNVDPRTLLDPPPSHVVDNTKMRQFLNELLKKQAEENLLRTFRSLNNDGKAKIIEYSKDIHKIAEYRADIQPPTTKSPVPSDQDE